jgi:hypothetical protein
MGRFIHKAVSFIVMGFGVMFTVVSVQLAVDMFRDPELGIGGALFITLLAFGISLSILYIGWRMWRSDKRTTHPSGGPRQSGRTALAGPAAGASPSAGSQKGVTVECPGCGAPVEVSPSGGGTCEYCGNQVPYRHPAGAV